MSRRGCLMLIALIGTLWSAPIGSMMARLPPSWSPALAAQGVWSPPTTVYIHQTGHTIDGVFLDVWRARGGAASFGYPITEEFETGGHIVQYYEYARFEYWPNDPQGNVVHFGDIGAELLRLLTEEADEAEVPATTPDGAEMDPAEQLARAAESREPGEVDTDTENRRFIDETGHTVQFGFKQFWEATGEAAFLGFALTEEYVVNGTTYQIFERGQLRWEPGSKVRMVPVGTELAERYGLDTSPAPQGNVPTYSEELFTPPPTPTPTTSGRTQPQPDPTAEKWIEVDLSTQYMIAWQGNVRVQESYVSTGKPEFKTPAGTYQILVKKPVEDMEGVIGGEYYNVPEVPDVLYFTNVGHAFHGTYWHSNFGTPMSHGCVNLPTDVADWLYSWAPIGTRVEIHE